MPDKDQKQPPVKKKNLVSIIVNNKNDPRLKSYNDSLRLYNQGTALKSRYDKVAADNNLDVWSEDVPAWNTEIIPNQKIQPITEHGYTFNSNDISLLLRKDGSYIKQPNDKLFDNGRFTTTDKDIFTYKKPIQPVILQKPIVYADKKQYKSRVRGTIIPSVPVIDNPTSSQLPVSQPKGTPVYGPSNGYIGDIVNRNFIPTIRRDHLSKANQADIDMLSDHEKIAAYVKSKGVDKFEDGGMVGPDDPKQKRKPIIVSNKNDPRLKAYNDSVALYNKGIAGRKMLKDSREIIYAGAPAEDRKDFISNFYRDISTEAYKDWKKTGIVPDREYIGNYNVSIGGINNLPSDYRYGYKKPVQPVVYQQSKSKEEIEYDNSLKDYNKRIKGWRPLTKEIAKGRLPEGSNLEGMFYAPKETSGNNILPWSRDNGKDYSITAFDKPVKPAARKPEVLADPAQYKSQVRGTITSPQPTYYTMKGNQPVYGPSGALIGMGDSKSFSPDLMNTAKRAKANQADIDLLNNPAELEKYINQKGYIMNKADKFADGGATGSSFLRKLFGGDGDVGLEGGENQSGNIDLGLDIASDFAGAYGGHGKYKAGAKGNAIGGGIGAAAGAFIGMPAIGKEVGSLIGGLIGGSRDRRDMADDASDEMRDAYRINNIQPNLLSMGTQYENGGATGPDIDPSKAAPPQQPAAKQINVEKGELMIDPSSGDIVRKFNNPNRFSKHKKMQYQEPMGNFVTVPDNMVIIPKKDAGRYERGDMLTRKSIMKRLLSEQAADPMHNVPEEMQPAEDVSAELPQYANGGTTSLGPQRGGYLDLSSLYNLNTQQSTGGPNEPDWSSYVGDPISMASNEGLPDEVMDTGDDQYSATGPARRSSENMLGKILHRAGSNLPIYAQMANAVQGDPFLGLNPDTAFTDQLGIAGQLPENISVAGNLQANDEGFASAERMISNNDTPSARAEAGELYARKLNADNQVYQGQQQVGAQLRSAKIAQILNITGQQGQSDQNARGILMNEQRMDQAARENTMMEGAANLSKNNRLADNDMESIRAINEVTHFIDINPYAKSLVANDPQAMGYIINYVTGGKGTMQQAITSYERSKSTTVTNTTKSGNGKQTVATKTRS